MNAADYRGKRQPTKRRTDTVTPDLARARCKLALCVRFARELRDDAADAKHAPADRRAYAAMLRETLRLDIPYWRAEIRRAKAKN